jgi:hypothetical protein
MSRGLPARSRARQRVAVLLAALLALLMVVPTAASALPSDESDEIETGAESAESAESPNLPTTDDPRVGLAPGPGETAGQAILNLTKLASLPMAPGASTNSDLAFFSRDGREYVISGNYNGFNIYDVTTPSAPTLRTTVLCPGSQNDVSVYGDLLFMSVEATSGKIDCSFSPPAATASTRFRGVRIWDISDLDTPVQLTGIQTCKGSHTHTLVTKPGVEDRIWVYVSGTAGVRSAAEPPGGCVGSSSLTDPNTANFSITVAEVSVAEETYGAAQIVNRNARVFSKCGDNTCEADHAVQEQHPDPRYGVRGTLNWLNTSGVQPTYPAGDPRAPGGQSVSQSSQCHDITAYPEIGLAAGACQGDGILMDITDPVNPRRIDNVTDFNFAYWHSATFNNDGTKVIFTDEWGGGSGARCRANDPLNWGANAIFDIVQTADGPRMEFRSYFKLPMVQTNQENCVAHNGSLIPVPGRDIMVQAWYQGGNTVFDFTDSSNPVEIAYFDRGPNSATQLQTGGFWSTYWHNGFIFGNEIARGFDVFDLATSEHLNAIEIAAAKQVRFDQYNVQNQERLTWPDTFTTVRAWHSALQRQGILSPELDANLTKFVNRAEEHNSSKNAAQRNSAAANLRAVSNQLGSSDTEVELRDALRRLADLVANGRARR